MKKLLLIIVLSFLCNSLVQADDARYKPWVYKDVKISEKCLNHLYPLASGDWYEEYYKQYFGKDLSFGENERMQSGIQIRIERVNDSLLLSKRNRSSYL